MTTTMMDLVTAAERWWLAFFLGLSVVLHRTLRASGAAPGKEKPLAFAAVSLVAQCHFVAYGLRALCDGTLAALSADAASRTMSSGSAAFAQLAQVAFAYEVYNTVAAASILEYRTGEFLGHHVLTAIIAKFSQTQGPDFYGFFYLGLAASSSVFLVFVDVFRHGPDGWRAALPKVNAVVRVVFALTFVAVRAVAWPLVSLAFWRDTISIIRVPPPGGGPWKPYLFMLLLSNTFLSALQIMWAKRIIAGLVKFGRKRAKAE